MNQQNKFTDMQGMTLRKFGGHTLVISSKILAATKKSYEQILINLSGNCGLFSDCMDLNFEP